MPHPAAVSTYSVANLAEVRPIDQVKAARATAVEVPASHVAMLPVPKAVAELIIMAAQ